MDTVDLPPMSDPNPVRERRGPLAWMTRNSVAANLLMAALLLGGLLFLGRIKQEVFPSVELDMVTIAVPYPGASPEEVERAITKTIEENVRSVDGVDEVTSTSAEGLGTVQVQLEIGANPDRALNDVKSAIDRIPTFPEDAEEPVVSLAETKNAVISLVVYGETSERTLHELANRLRDEILSETPVSKAELVGGRTPEISIEVPRDKLRAYGLTLEQVASAVRGANIELPAGKVRTKGGEILLRTTERRDFGQQFEDVVVVARPDGAVVRLSDLATIEDGFGDVERETTFNGKPSVEIAVYRVGNETPIEIADAVKTYVDEHRADLPPGIEVATWDDRSRVYQDRIDLLMRNASTGLLLVLFALGLFLEIRLAFWVTLGIPLSFLGALIFLPNWGVSVNMISLFAFIVTLGIVVDDAIVVGEAVHQRRQEGMPPAKAAVTGLHDVAGPVVFSVLTTVVAFSPLLFVPGTMGKFFRNIPTVVITVLLLSLVESLLILPAHLAHANPIATSLRKFLASLLGERLGPFGAISRAQQRFAAWFDRTVETKFQPFVEATVRQRYLALATATAILIASLGLVASGRLNFTFLPKIESDVVFVKLEMPVGTPFTVTERHAKYISDQLQALLVEEGLQEDVQGESSYIGWSGRGGEGSHIAESLVYLVPPDEREFTTTELVQKWRERVGQIPGARSVKFNYTTGASSGAAISVGVSHRDQAVAEAAAVELGRALGDFAGVTDIDDGVAQGKRQIDFKLRPAARSLGVDSSNLARQLRSAFFGVEASRQQRGRDELRVYVRLPEEERSSLYDLEELLVRTPEGGEIPVSTAAELSWGQAYTAIQRQDFQRVVMVEADVDDTVSNANKVMAGLQRDVMPRLRETYPGLSFVEAGQQKSQSDSLAALATGFQLALIAMFALMAIPFKSYAQPLVIMVAIPFGIVGAVLGHLIMGYDLSILSAMGFVALSGVVVNDSLVLITATNEYRAQGMTSVEAVVAGATRRFRPILLTSLTTFLGLAPMILETSVQARFLVPMAISLGFGVLFTTFVILLVVPSLYVILEDIKNVFSPKPDIDVIDRLPAE